MHFPKRFHSLIICFALIFEAKAQDSTLTYNMSLLGGSSTSGTLPFWTKANQNGILPEANTFALAKLGVYKIFHPHDPRFFQWSSGIEGIASYGKKPDFFLTDAYLAAKLGQVEIMAGQRKTMTGITDTLLTSGSLSISGNARPIPGLQISIPEFYPLPLTNYFVSVKASYSEGILPGTDILYGASKEIGRTYFHQKSFYLKIGQPEGRLHFWAGINHQVIWGGESRMEHFNKINANIYLKAISGSRINHIRVGEHLGTYDVGVKWHKKNWNYFVYHQSIFNGANLFNPTSNNGLTGLSISVNQGITSRAFKMRAILVEYINTSNATFINNSTISPTDQVGNYYNHYLYANGWSFRGRGIGTPLAPDKNETKNSLPKNASEFTNNDHFVALHAALKFDWQSIAFTLKAVHSLNYGSYLTRFDQKIKQTSVLLSAEKNLPTFNGIITYLAISSDIGGLYPQTYGGILGFRKTGFLTK